VCAHFVSKIDLSNIYYSIFKFLNSFLKVVVAESHNTLKIYFRQALHRKIVWPVVGLIFFTILKSLQYVFKPLEIKLDFYIDLLCAKGEKAFHDCSQI